MKTIINILENASTARKKRKQSKLRNYRDWLKEEAADFQTKSDTLESICARSRCITCFEQGRIVKWAGRAASMRLEAEHVTVRIAELESEL